MQEPTKKKSKWNKVKPKPVNHLVGKFMIGMANNSHAHKYDNEEFSFEDPDDSSDE